MAAAVVVISLGVVAMSGVAWYYAEHLSSLRRPPMADPHGEPVAIPLFLYGDLSSQNMTQRRIVVPSEWL
jgi:hypothetical protein